MARPSPPADALAQFTELIDQLQRQPGMAEIVRTGFGDRPLYAGRKMFGFLDFDGALVLKLPAERVVELVRGKGGAPWGVAPGQYLKEYLSVDLSRSSSWFQLAKESHAFMSGQNRRSPPRSGGGPTTKRTVGKRPSASRKR